MPKENHSRGSLIRCPVNASRAPWLTIVAALSGSSDEGPHRIAPIDWNGDRCALATTETIYDVVQDRPDSLGDLVARGRRARGCVPAGASSNSAEFFFDGP